MSKELRINVKRNTSTGVQGLTIYTYL